MEIIDKNRLPKHIAVIMDGNGRWAKSKGKARVFGHKNGVESVRAITKGAAEIGIEYLTLYAFSTENWNRPKAEITALMTLLVLTISKETKTLNKNNVRLHTIGNLDNLPNNCSNELKNAIESTKNNTGLNLILALSYSARWEITEAAKKIAKEVESNNLIPEDITEDTLMNHLCTSAFPDPELLIRTSGECRISNFLLWQIAYSELYFTPTLWPDFRKKDLEEAIISYQQRERRFGKISEQLETENNS
jgi:undecaprenyl diphosphate synthase